MLSCSSNNDKKESVIKSKYICPMQCKNSTSELPGACPVCNMMLVKELEMKGMDQKVEHSTESVYKFNGHWTNQDNKKVQLSDYSGKLQLTTMIFTHCDYACPNIIADLQNIQDGLSEKARENLGFLLVTIDPENDTPEKLKKYASNFELDNKNWQFLTGSKDDIYQYSKLLGIQYKKFENGMYGHSNIITLLSTTGEIIYQIEGIHANIKPITELINKQYSR
jgi:protein SCO1/2